MYGMSDNGVWPDVVCDVSNEFGPWSETKMSPQAMYTEMCPQPTSEPTTSEPTTTEPTTSEPTTSEPTHDPCNIIIGRFQLPDLYIGVCTS